MAEEGTTVGRIAGTLRWSVLSARARARAASILDNLDMMQDVLSDVLVHPGVADRRAAVNEVLRQFTTREFRCVQTDEWIVVALRHSIFAQGGFALRPMDAYERNAF